MQIITDKVIIIFKDYNDIEIYEKNLKIKKSKTIKTFSNSNIQFLYNYIYKNLKNKNKTINDNLVLSNYNHKIINKLHNENNLALFGGKKTCNFQVKPFSSIGREELVAASKVIKSGTLSEYLGEKSREFNGGKYVNLFERQCEKYF